MLLSNANSAHPSRRNALLLGLALGVGALPSWATEVVKVVTEEYPPYNYTDHGKLTGLGTEVVQAVLKEINIEGQFQSLPWARAYETAQNTESVLIYSMNRSKEREKLFKWVGTIAPSDYYLYSLKSRNIQLANLDAAKELQIGSVHQAIGEQYLLAQGFEIGRNLQPSTKYELNYEKLKQGRVDLWVVNELGASYIARQAGDDPAQLLHKSLHLVDISTSGNYMAFGLKTPDTLVERFRKGLETIKKNGVYDALQKKWL